MAIDVVLSGYGKMGKMIADVIKTAGDMRIVFAIDTYDGLEGNLPIHDSKKLSADSLISHRPDIWMDFSTVEAAYQNIPKVVDAGVKVLIGTTGFTKEQREYLENYIEGKVPCVWSNNYSLGANVLRKAARAVADSLPLGYDAAIYELHHNQKADSPSGTADMYKADLEASGKFQGEVFRQRGKQKRQANEIDMSSARIGTIPGKHTITIAGNDEMIELVHTAFSRAVFARGAVEFARKLYELEEPRIYTVEELL